MVKTATFYWQQESTRPKDDEGEETIPEPLQEEDVTPPTDPQKTEENQPVDTSQRQDLEYQAKPSAGTLTSGRRDAVGSRGTFYWQQESYRPEGDHAGERGDIPDPLKSEDVTPPTDPQRSDEAQPTWTGGSHGLDGPTSDLDADEDVVVSDSAGTSIMSISWMPLILGLALAFLTLYMALVVLG
jgi:hypothetical protein